MQLPNLSEVQHHPAIEELVEVLARKTQNTDRGFFRTEVAYFLGKLASCMRATISTKDRGEVPVNIYALALATSGFGKGHSVAVMENLIMKPFERAFMQVTFPNTAENNLQKLADQRAVMSGTDPNEELEKVITDFKSSGAYPFTFDSGTPPAVKQLRHKLLLAQAGAINLQIDEIGSNLLGSVDLLTVFLELFDQGLVKQKLTKNTAESKRMDEVEGKTPTNLLLFGTPSKLFDGSKTEDEFYAFLETGYARRCLFGYGQHESKAHNSMTAKEVYELLVDNQNDHTINKWANHFVHLADQIKVGTKIKLPDAEAIMLLQYKMDCEHIADALPEHDTINKAELSHRYFKALKLAGALAFVDEAPEITVAQLLPAIKLVEESGESFKKILTREKTYAKLAKYIAEVDTELTHADLDQALPFYPKGNAARSEIMSMAQAWGYRSHMIIKKTFSEGIEFFRGETLKNTSLDEISISYSEHYAYDYSHEIIPFSSIQTLCQTKGIHWANHAFKDNHRLEDKAIPGFNLLVLDIDKGIQLPLALELLKGFTYAIYTTKRHSNENHRFRLLIPMNYHLKLDAEEYKQFMLNLSDWLPIEVDVQTSQRSRKWEANAGGDFYYNEGDLLDVLPFVPKISRSENYAASIKKLKNLSNLQRWFAQQITGGNRNNNMLKYAMCLLDSGMDLATIKKETETFNGMLDEPLSKAELETTVFKTVSKKWWERHPEDEY